LRDDKLIAAAAGLEDGLLRHSPEPEGQKLIIENMGKLDREGGGTSS
jgi:hypothetical protein